MSDGDVNEGELRGTVILAEDDDELRMVLALTFAAAGYEVGTASNGPEMIALIEATASPSAIIIDLLLPGVLGNSVLEYVRREPRLAAVPTAIVTGFPDLAPAGFPVFAKPAPIEALLWFVQSGGRLTPPPVADLN